MKAIVYDHYGPPEVWRIADVPAPEAKPGEVLIRIHSTAITRSDCETRDANRKSGAPIALLSRLLSGVLTPRQPILGKDFAGVVEAIGDGTAEFQPGDRVFGSTGFRFGAFAELIAIPEAARIV